MDIWTAEKIILLGFLLKGVCCRDFSISLPQNIQALSGSCVTIKCRFEIQEQYDKNLTESAAIGLWFKDGDKMNDHLVFHSTDPQPNCFNGKITGNLHEKNCTTIFYNVSSKHTGRYYFRIESGDLKYFYTMNTSINVTDSPPKPTVQLYVEQKEVQDQEEVLEGRSVSLRCSAETLCSSPPPTLTWSSTPRIPLSESSGLEELISDLNFTATHRQHRVTFTCTITYQLQDETKTAQDSITLHVQYAPKISPSSSCTRTDVTVCFCEADGNPSPELEWHLSGHSVTNSSNMFISEERLSSTGLRSSITLHQSFTHTSTLQCVSNNTHGTASHQFNLLHSTPQVSGFHHFSFLLGVAGGASVMMIICGILLICARRESNTRRDDGTELILAHREDESGPDCANNAMLSPTGSVTQNHEELHYTQPESEEIRGISSLTTDYAVVQHYPGGVSEAESSTGGDQPNSSIAAVVMSEKNQTVQEQEAKMGEVFSQQSEDTTYENINI
uniref:Ig-like domain-containing protein n=1 Tax=Cyprinus carpio TaxID=7962 RepID=A0A8C2B8L1_CYPCA